MGALRIEAETARHIVHVLRRVFDLHNSAHRLINITCLHNKYNTEIISFFKKIIVC
jgi:hypothetical protein